MASVPPPPPPNKKNEDEKVNKLINTLDTYFKKNHKYIQMEKIPPRSLFKMNEAEFSRLNSINFCGRVGEKKTHPALTQSEEPPSKFIKIDENIIPEFVQIDREISSINDLIQILNDFPIVENVEYNINVGALHNIRRPLIELNNMIGMASLKQNIVDQICYFLQNLHISRKNDKVNSNDYMHTVIYGPPGTGKTEVAKIIGNIFSRLGILKKNKFRKVTRADLIAGYLGQTALKTKDVIKDCLGGVLFIDEAYALGNEEKRDSFSKECLDTLCEALSDHKDNLMVIIAGYEKELKNCFFNFNEGLESRFTWRFKVDDYNSDELKQIFEKKVRDHGWVLKETIPTSWFEKNKEYFKYFGRDMEILFSRVKIAHSRRVFCKPENEKTKITLKDLEKGFEMFLQNEEVKNRKMKENLPNMYL